MIRFMVIEKTNGNLEKPTVWIFLELMSLGL